MVTEAVSEITELDAVQTAIELIDGGLTTMQHREIVSSGEVADLLLDLRTLLVPLVTPRLDEEVAVARN
jgi:hypothetical protein